MDILEKGRVLGDGKVDWNSAVAEVLVTYMWKMPQFWVFTMYSDADDNGNRLASDHSIESARMSVSMLKSIMANTDSAFAGNGGRRMDYAYTLEKFLVGLDILPELEWYKVL